MRFPLHFLPLLAFSTLLALGTETTPQSHDTAANSSSSSKAAVQQKASEKKSTSPQQAKKKSKTNNKEEDCGCKTTLFGEPVKPLTDSSASKKQGKGVSKQTIHSSGGKEGGTQSTPQSATAGESTGNTVTRESSK
ncbi:MAG: hypothetical protein U0V70_04025 [Terriglobia bacterium]